MSDVKISPATLIDLSFTMPPRESTAIYVVQPPISMIILPLGSCTSMPIPIAAAIGHELNILL